MLTEIFILLSLVFLEAIAEYELKTASIMKTRNAHLYLGIFFYSLVAIFFYLYRWRIYGSSADPFPHISILQNFVTVFLQSAALNDKFFCLQVS